MHIEPGVVVGAKAILGYATGAAAGAVALKLAVDTVAEKGLGSVLARTAAATALTFFFFEILPHHPVGVSEVHLILGTTLFLIFGTAPAALGLALGLAVQGLFFAPTDLPQYGMNVTTLLVPLFGIAALAHRIIPAGTAYVDLTYRQALELSIAYQGGIVLWVAFWALWGHGAESIPQILSFGAAYMTVIIVEPLADLGVLALAKRIAALNGSGWVSHRLHNPVA